MIGRFDARPDDRKLRQFGAACVIFLGMIWAPLCLMRDRPRAALALGLAAVAGGLAGAFRPRWLRPAWVLLSLVTVPLGWIVSTIAMLVIWWLVVTPTAIIRRLLGHDGMRRRLEPSATTYWRAREPPTEASYLRRF
jgi:hypothetical protein